ncbi:MAG: helix-turn-helix domain-containing protein [Bdellovibrionota bacterium]|nr:MAG: helix-turn-helix domain-containing protein [Bdellovibrionota bacterium]
MTYWGQIERKYLEVALLQARGAKKRAAELLGINFRSFRYRLQKYGLQGQEDQESELREQ